MIQNFIAHLFFDGLLYRLGLLYVWVKNRGRKSFKVIAQETTDPIYIGTGVFLKAMASFMVLLFSAMGFILLNLPELL